MADPETLQALTRWGLSFVIALAIGMARPLGVALIFPAFTRFQLIGLIRTVVVMMIALPAIPYVLDEMASGGTIGALFLGALILKELFIGLMLGLVLSVPFWGVIAAGDLIDFQRGSMMGLTVDPSFTTETSPMANLLFLLTTVLFVVASGFFILVEIIYQSYEVWPLMTFGPELTVEGAKTFIDLLGAILEFAFLIGAPIVMIMFLTDVALALLLRYAPQLNIFELSLAGKSAVLVAVLPLYAIFLHDFLERDLANIRVMVQQFVTSQP